MRGAALALIRFYQRAISPALPAACRYQPTCSRYAYDAIERYGALRGGWLALRRLLRCVPWKPGGYDPVPLHETRGAGGTFERHEHYERYERKHQA